MALWAIKLSEFDIQYRPRTTIKGQIIADFITVFTLVKGQGAKESPWWSIHTEGSSNKQAGGAGMVLHSPKGDKIECIVRLDFPMTNNEAEYEALIMRLDLANSVRATNLVIYCNFRVVNNQVNGDYECKNKWMKKYLEQVKGRVSSLQVKFGQIPRKENEHANRLAKTASAKHMLVPSHVLSFVQVSSLIDDTSV